MKRSLTALLALLLLLLVGVGCQSAKSAAEERMIPYAGPAWTVKTATAALREALMQQPNPPDRVEITPNAIVLTYTRTRKVYLWDAIVNIEVFYENRNGRFIIVGRNSERRVFKFYFYEPTLASKTYSALQFLQGHYRQ